MLRLSPATWFFPGKTFSGNGAKCKEIALSPDSKEALGLGGWCLGQEAFHVPSVARPADRDSLAKSSHPP